MKLSIALELIGVKGVTHKDRIVIDKTDIEEDIISQLSKAIDKMSDGWMEPRPGFDTRSVVRNALYTELPFKTIIWCKRIELSGKIHSKEKGVHIKVVFSLI